MKVSLLRKVRKDYVIYRLHDDIIDENSLRFNFNVSYRGGKQGVLDSENFRFLSNAIGWIREHVQRKWSWYFFFVNFKERQRRREFRQKKNRKIKESRKVYYNEKSK